MDPGDTNGGVLGLLATAIVALSAALGFNVRKQSKKPVENVDSAPLTKAAMEMLQASAVLTEKVSIFCARVDKYHERTGELEAAVGDIAPRLRGVEDDIKNINAEQNRQWDSIGLIRSDTDKIKGKLGL